MAVKNILPSLQADEKSAQLHVRALPMPNMLGNVGSLLSDAGNNIQGLGVKLALAFKAEHDRQNEQASRIRQNSDRLKLNERINAYRNFVTTNLDEFSKLKGAQADGSTDKLMEAISKKRDAFTVNLNQEQLREFNLEAAQIDFAARRNILNHEDSNVREANIQSNQLSIQNISANYARTGDPENMPQLLRAIEGLYQATTGAAPADGAKITELLKMKDALEREGGKEEEIAKIDKELENLGLRTKAFYEMRDAVVEQMFLARFDYLEKQNDFVEARKFYLEHEGRLSEQAKNRMLKVLNDTERTETIRYKANVRLNSKVVTEDGVDNMYWTPEHESKVAMEIEELENKIIEDPEHAEDYEDELKAFKEFATARKNAGQARFAQDYMSATKDIELNVNDISGLMQNLKKLQDLRDRTSSPSLKQAFTELYAKYQQHLESATKELHKTLENDPARKSFVTSFIVEAATQETDFFVTIGEGRYDLKTEDGRKRLREDMTITFDENGNQVGLFTPNELDFLEEIVKSPNNNYISQAAGDLVEAINRKTGSKRKLTVPQLLAFAPEAVDQVLRWRARMSNDYKNLKPDQLEAQDKGMIDTIISQELDIPWEKDKSLAKAITKFFEDNNGEIDVTKIKEYVSGIVYPQDEVRGELNKSMIATSTHPYAKKIREGIRYEEAAKTLPETSERVVTDVTTNINKVLRKENPEEKAAREAEEKAAAEKAEARRKRMEAPVVVSPGVTPSNTYGLKPR